MTPRRALISVSDKTGLEDFVRELTQRGVEILSTGGTFAALKRAGIAAQEVSAHTGFPEIMGGRVKTLHPAIHGGILGRRGVDDAVMQQHGIAPIDLVVVNLYPFEQTVAQPQCTRELAIENIDIGGPAMVRAAAKNHAHVGVVVDPADYDAVLSELRQGALTAATRERLAVKAFAHTARYDAAVAAYLSGNAGDGTRATFPAVLGLQFHKIQDLRYGENPHQTAAFYADAPQAGTLAAARQLHGKALSYNNLADADAALACVQAFAEAPACVIVKHANPCGVALGSDCADAYQRAFATDATSAFGGIIAFNRRLTRAAVDAVIGNQFVEVLIAPDADDDAVAALQSKPNVRLLVVGNCSTRNPTWEYKRVSGGVLVQSVDHADMNAMQLRTVTRIAPDHAQHHDLLFAWRVARFVKSNAIVYARNGQTLGIGAGQMSRVDSARIAALKAADAGFELRGAVMASDAFFPFRDGIDTAADRGITAIIQPGGSMRDPEVIAAADEYGMAMVFTGIRHFRH